MDELKVFLENIASFRRKLGLTQKEFGTRLKLTARQVNYFETEPAASKIKGHILERLAEEFKDDIPHNIRSLISAQIPDSKPVFKEYPFVFEEDFVDQQQFFLEKNEGIYSIWLINMAEIAMLNSEKLEDCWAENIIDGINYSVVWDLSFSEGEYLNRFEQFIGSVQRILDIVLSEKTRQLHRNDANNLSEKRKNLSPGIDIFAYYSCGHLKEVIASNGVTSNETKLIESYIDVCQRILSSYEFEKYRDVIRIHFPFPEELFSTRRSKHWRFFRDTSIKNAGMVLYKPNKFSKGINIAVLEPSKTRTNFFDKSEGSRGFLFLGESISNHYNQGIDEFEKWYDNEFSLPAADSIKAFLANPINLEYLVSIVDNS